MTWWFVAACALSAALHQGWLVPRLPRRPAADGDIPPRYDELGSPMDVAAVSVGAAGCAALVAQQLDPWAMVLWWAYLGGGASLAWVDLRTTWLPLRLTQAVGAAMAVGAIVAAVDDPGVLVRVAVGAAAAHLLFLAVWRVTGSMGFGDVRLAALVGAVAAAGGPERWGAGLLFGTLIGAVWGIAHAVQVRRRGGERHFAYGPALWLGPVAAAAVSGWWP